MMMLQVFLITDSNLRSDTETRYSVHTRYPSRFHRQTATKSPDAGAVPITGPAKAKTELVKHIDRHMPVLKAKIAGVETVDHPTDGELVAQASK
jgi:hypothetical protein